MDELKKNGVLIVDDENANIMALTHILGSEYTMYAAKNGQKALEAAEKYNPDLILLDIMMPEMDGYAVISLLKNSGKTMNIPVIFITGLSDISDEEKGLALGAADYISKPFSPAIVKLRVWNQIKLINQTRLIIEKETAEKSSRSRSEFLSRMSHEIRTPMNAIMGIAALIKNTSDTLKRDDMLDKINNASSQLLEIIDNVLDMSDIEDHKFRLSSSEFSFTAMMQDILNKAGTKLNNKQTLSSNIDPSIPDKLAGDKKRLSQVIMNLLSNAHKFTPEHGLIQINAFVRELEDETLTMQIDVIDNGIGISKEHREKLFIPFEQEDGGIDRKFGGAGLGLPISKYIVAMMGGKIWVESEPGKGSKFSFTVKTQLIAPITENVTKSDDCTPISLDGKNLLLADDVEINREIIMAMLEDTGLQITCAENGRQALDLFTSEPEKFNIILMDINMPEMDGVESTRRIRAIESERSSDSIASEFPSETQGASLRKQVPIIAMTANVIMSEVETYLSAGMNDHVGKPVDYDLLLNRLYKYLK